MPTEHELKVLPVFFGGLLDGTKTFEIRERRDRKFEVGDALYLREWDPNTERYTGFSVFRRVIYVADLESIGLPGYVAMSIVPVEETF